MKTVKPATFWAVSLLAIMLLSLTACSSGLGSGGSGATTIEATWRITEESVWGNHDGEWKWMVWKYPDEYGNQPYIQMKNGSFCYYYWYAFNEEMFLETTITYTISGSSISLLADGSTLNGTYTISGDQLTLQFEENDEVDYIKAVRADDSIVDSGAGDNIGNDQGSGSNYSACESQHLKSEKSGSLWNPLEINLGEIVADELPEYLAGGQMRYFLKVDPAVSYRVTVFEINANYTDVNDFFKYLEVSVSDETYPDQNWEEVRISENETSGQVVFTSSTGCLYVLLQSYQKGIEYKLVVEKN